MDESLDEKCNDWNAFVEVEVLIRSHMNKSHCGWTCHGEYVIDGWEEGRKDGWGRHIRANRSTFARTEMHSCHHLLRRPALQSKMFKLKTLLCKQLSELVSNFSTSWRRHSTHNLRFVNILSDHYFIRGRKRNIKNENKKLERSHFQSKCKKKKRMLKNSIS